MKICVQKSTSRILEMQSAAPEGLLISNAVSQGYKAEDVEELEVDAVGYMTALSKDPVEIALRAAVIKKAQDILAAKEAVSNSIQDTEKAKDIDELKIVMLDLIRAVRVLIS